MNNIKFKLDTMLRKKNQYISLQDGLSTRSRSGEFDVLDEAKCVPCAIRAKTEDKPSLLIERIWL